MSIYIFKIKCLTVCLTTIITTLTYILLFFFILSTGVWKLGLEQNK